MINLKAIVGSFLDSHPDIWHSIPYLRTICSGIAAGAAMGSRRSGGSLFDGSVACCGRCLHLDERSESVVSRSIRYVLLRVRCSFAYDETKAGHTSGWRTDRRFRSTGTWWRGLRAGRKLTCRRGHFSRMATTYGGTRQGRALSVCVFHADFRRATLHACTVHRHADPGLDARTLVLSVLYWGCVYRRRNCNSEWNTSASRSLLLGLMFFCGQYCCMRRGYLLISIIKMS
jgi:hypothetical protein